MCTVSIHVCGSKCVVHVCVLVLCTGVFSSVIDTMVISYIDS